MGRRLAQRLLLLAMYGGAKSHHTGSLASQIQSVIQPSQSVGWNKQYCYASYIVQVAYLVAGFRYPGNDMKVAQCI